MYLNVRLVYFMFVIAGCKNNDSENNVFPNISTIGSNTKSQNDFATIKKIPLPIGFKRVGVEENSFAEWLQNVSLKDDKTVYLFDGSQKTNQQAQFAILKLSAVSVFIRIASSPPSANALRMMGSFSAPPTLIRCKIVDESASFNSIALTKAYHSSYGLIIH